MQIAGSSIANNEAENTEASILSSSALSEDDKKGAIDMLREASRQHYLEKREQRELKLLELNLKVRACAYLSIA